MKEIDSSRMLWTLYQDQEEYYLSVICGSVAIFETSIRLSKSEYVQYSQQGSDILDRISSKVRNSPKDYQSVNIKK